MGQGVPDGIEIRPVRAADRAAYKALRLEALRSHPEAFGSDYSELANQPDAFWESRIRASLDGQASRIVVAAEAGADEANAAGANADGTGADGAGGANCELAGMAGVFRDEGVKTRHSATLVAVYVAPRWRGRRLADAMVREVLAWCAAGHVRILRLAVATGNVPAVRCYHRCGFHVCGVQPEVIRVGVTYHDELLMWRRV